jgi:hypothetical protein
LTWPIFDNTAWNNKKPAESYENSTYKLKLLPVLKLHLVFHVSGKKKKRALGIILLRLNNEKQLWLVGGS